MISRVLKACAGYWESHIPTETWISQPKDERLLPESMKVHYLPPPGRSNAATIALMKSIESKIKVMLVLE